MRYQVLVENGDKNAYTATVVGLPDCRAQASTRHRAVAKVHEALKARLARAQVVWLDVDGSLTGHPWLGFVGIHRDNPLFDDVQADIEAYRRELDADLQPV